MEDSVTRAIMRLTWAQRSLKQWAGPPLEGEDKFEWPVLRALMPQARLFVIDYDQFLRICASEIAEQAPEVEAPSVLPFECVFLTPDSLNGESLHFGVGYDAELAGFVLSLQGSVFRAWAILRDSKGAAVFLALYTGGDWRGVGNLSSQVVTKLAAAMNQQPAIAPPLSFSQRRRWKQLASGTGAYPQPFYRVESPAITTLTRLAPGTQGHWAPGFRFDSRAHRRLLCRRGDQPLSADDRGTLELRGYQVFAADEVPEHWLAAMKRRGHVAPSLGEWVAVRYTQVKQSIKGAPHLPYMPSTRRA